MIRNILPAFFSVLSFTAAAQQNASFEVKLKNSHNGLPVLISFNPAAADKPASENMAVWFRANLGANTDFALKQENTFRDVAGNRHVRYRQYYKDIFVEGTLLQLHYSRSGTLTSMTGLYFPAVSVNTDPALTEAQALAKAMELYGATAQFAWQDEKEEAFLKTVTRNPQATYYPEGSLVIMSDQCSRKPEDLRLAYKFNVYVLNPFSRELVYVDASDGHILFREELIHTIDRPGKAYTRYSGVQTIMCDSAYADTFFLRETGRGMGIETYNANNTLGGDTCTMFFDDDNVWDHANANQDDVATDVHWGLEMTYDYYKAKLARESYDDLGGTLYGLVHVNKKFNNAFWNGQFASFGDGDSITFKPLASLDVCGHEISHGMTQTTAGLIYFGQSGALNESFSDIFGKGIERHILPDNFTWKIGNNIKMNGQPLRDMQDPNIQQCPRYYQGKYYYTGPFDNGGVHINSGVQNYWFYLLCEGGSGKREDAAKNPFTVKAIGMDKATQIAYTTLSAYLNSGSDYFEASAASIEVAKALFGDNSEEVRQTKMAWYAVGLAEFPGYGVGTTMPVYNGASLYPNPASGSITLLLPLHTPDIEVSITDITGKIVQTMTLPVSGNIDISTLQNGMYFLSLPDGTALKFVKN